MQVTVHLFGLLRESLGEVIILSLAAPYTAEQLLTAFITEHPKFRALRESLLVAADEQYVKPRQSLKNAKKLALFPPLGGGSDVPEAEQDFSPSFYLSEEPLELGRLLAELQSLPASRCSQDKPYSVGGLSIFLGVVREFNQGKKVRYLEYQAERAMVLIQLRELATQLRQRWGVERLMIAHRLGRVKVGETSLAVLVGTEHRQEAMSACQYAVEWIKTRLPIWKKEISTSGQQWIANSST